MRRPMPIPRSVKPLNRLAGMGPRASGGVARHSNVEYGRTRNVQLLDIGMSSYDFAGETTGGTVCKRTSGARQKLPGPGVSTGARGNSHGPSMHSTYDTLQPPLPLQEFLPAQPLSPDLQPP